MKKLLLLLLALTLALTFISCGSDYDDEDYTDYDEEEIVSSEEEIVDLTPSDWTEVLIDGEKGSTKLYYKNKIVEFTMPANIDHYTRLKQSSPELLVMSHDTRTHTSGRTIIALGKGTLNPNEEGFEQVTVGGRDGILKKTAEETVNAMNKTVKKLYYEYLTDLGSGILMSITVDASFSTDREVQFDDNIIQTLLDNCKFN